MILIINKNNLIVGYHTDNQDIRQSHYPDCSIRWVDDKNVFKLPSVDDGHGFRTILGADVSGYDIVTDKPKTEVELLREKVDELLAK